MKPPPHWISDVVKISKEGVFCTYSSKYVDSGATSGAVIVDIGFLRKYRADLYKKIMKNDKNRRRGGISRIYFEGRFDTTETDKIVHVYNLLSKIPDDYKQNTNVALALSIMQDHLKNVDIGLLKQTYQNNHDQANVHSDQNTFLVTQPRQNMEGNCYHHSQADIQASYHDGVCPLPQSTMHTDGNFHYTEQISQSNVDIQEFSCHHTQANIQLDQHENVYAFEHLPSSNLDISDQTVDPELQQMLRDIDSC